jgi:hypothetical protein
MTTLNTSREITASPKDVLLRLAMRNGSRVGGGAAKFTLNESLATPTGVIARLIQSLDFFML